MKETIITVDVGTSSLRCFLYDKNGNILYTTQKNYSPIFLDNNYVEQEPRSFKKTLQQTLTDTGHYINEKKYKVLGISVTSQRASVITMNYDNKPIYNAIMWQDKRSYNQCEKIKEKTTLDYLYLKTGLKLDPYFSAPKMMWLKENEPEIYCMAYKLIGVQDYIIFLLTGRYVTDYTQASRTMLMDINTFKWDDDLIELFGIEKTMLPDLVEPGSEVGVLTNEMSKKTGLEKDIPIIIAGGDQQCAALGLNILRPGYIEANTGTGSFVIGYSEKPVFDSRMRTLCSASAIPGKWICEAGLLTSGTIYRWFNNDFYDNLDEKDLYGRINNDAESAPIGSNGVVVLPHFKGSAAPYWNPLAKGMIFNVSLSTKRSDVARAILEGIVLEMTENIELIQNQIGRIDVVSIAGGLTKFDLFNQIQADAFNKATVRYKNNEASSLGAWMQAVINMGIFDSYDEAFKRVTQGCKPKTFHSVTSNVIKYMKLKQRKKILYYALNEMDVYKYFQNPIYE